MKAFVGLGSNLGEREAMIRLALDDLARLPSTLLLRASSLYDTEPVGEVDQPNFLNAVAQIDTELTARRLLWNLQLIEKRLGRVRAQRWGRAPSTSISCSTATRWWRNRTSGSPIRS